MRYLIFLLFLFNVCKGQTCIILARTNSYIIVEADTKGSQVVTTGIYPDIKRDTIKVSVCKIDTIKSFYFSIAGISSRAFKDSVISCIHSTSSMLSAGRKISKTCLMTFSNLMSDYQTGIEVALYGFEDNKAKIVEIGFRRSKSDSAYSYIDSTRCSDISGLDYITSDEILIIGHQDVLDQVLIDHFWRDNGIDKGMEIIMAKEIEKKGDLVGKPIDKIIIFKNSFHVEMIGRCEFR